VYYVGTPGPVGPAGERGYPGTILMLWEKNKIKWNLYLVTGLPGPPGESGLPGLKGKLLIIR